MTKQKKKKYYHRNEPKLPKKDKKQFFLVYGIWFAPIFILFLYLSRTQFPLLKHIYGNNMIYGELGFGCQLTILLFFLILLISSVSFYESATSFKIPFKDFFKGGKGVYGKTKKHFQRFVIFTTIIYILTGASLIISCFQCTTIDETRIIKNYLIKQDEVLLTYDDINEIELIATSGGYRSPANFGLTIKGHKNNVKLSYNFFSNRFETIDEFLKNFDSEKIHIDEYSYENALHYFPECKELIDKYR